MVILESMQYGVPFLCTDVGNVRELHRKLVVHSSEEMAQKIDRLLEDSNYYKQITEELHERIQEYSYEQIVKNLENLLGWGGGRKLMVALWILPP